MSTDLRCHRCSSWIGESAQPLELVGIFKDPKDRKLVEGPRETHRCKSCGWINVFNPSQEPSRTWRAVDVKAKA